MAPRRQRLVFFIIYSIARLVRPLFARLEVERAGADGFDPLPPCVIAANHTSFFDVPVGFEYFGRVGGVPAIVVADRFFKTIGIGQALRAIGALRARKGGAEQLVTDAVAQLAAGRNVAIFPEGRLVPKGERVQGVGRAYTTLIDIARAANVPIIPIGISGSDAVWSLGKKIPHFSRHRPTVTAHIAAPMWIGDDDNPAALDRLMKSIASLVEQGAGH